MKCFICGDENKPCKCFERLQKLKLENNIRERELARQKGDEGGRRKPSETRVKDVEIKKTKK